MSKKLTSVYALLGISLLCMGAVFALRARYLPPQIPLLYSRLEGENQIVDTPFIVLLPSLLTIMVIVNELIKKKYFSSNDFISSLIYYVNISMMVFFTFIFIKIIFLVT